MRKQYHFRPSENGFYAWDVDRLIELSKHLTPHEIPVHSIRELDEPYWFRSEHDKPTCRAVIEHAGLIQNTDLSFPVILCDEGRVMDGMHRVGKAVLLGRKKIRSIRFKKTPEPDYLDVQPEDLPY